MNQLKIHVGKQEILSLRKTWIALQHNPNSDFYHFLLVCDLRPEVVNPIAFSYWKSNKCCCIVCGRIEFKNLSPAIGYLKLPSFKIKCLTIIHEGVIGAIDDQGALALLNAIKKIQTMYKVDVVHFHHLSNRNEAIWNALSCVKYIEGVQAPQWNKHWAITLEKKQGFLLGRMNSKHRSYIKKLEKNMYRDFNNDIRWVWHREFELIENICEKLEMVSSKTYQRGLNAGFINNCETRARLKYFSCNGQLRVMLLEIKGKPVCFWYGVVYKNVFYAEATGYLPEFEKYIVGTQTLLRTVDALIEEGIEKFDFGLGDANYKARFSNISWNEANVQLFNKTLKSIFIMYYVKIINQINSSLKIIVSKAGIINKLKKNWRIALRDHKKR